MENPPTDLPDEFKMAMKEWIDIKQVITGASKDLKGLRDRERNLKTYLKGFMKANKLDACNTRGGAKVSYNAKPAKKGITKKTIEQGLLEFFGGDQTKTSAAIEAIENNREQVERQTLSLRGLKTVEE